MSPRLLGISHLGLSVPDLAVADFFIDVLGFESISDDSDVRFVVHRNARIAIAFTTHDGSVTGEFDEHNPGLDHLALAVSDVSNLAEWESDLRRRGVNTSGVVESDAGHHLNFRAPGSFPIELFVINDAMAQAVGIPLEEAFAGSHS
jgi:catechol-2,3-dioxygenase